MFKVTKRLTPNRHEDCLHEHMWVSGPTKQKALKELFTALNPDIILLQETMCDHIAALCLFAFMKPGWEFCAIDAHGLSGGILSA